MIKAYSYQTFIGPITIIENDGHLVEIRFGDEKVEKAPSIIEETAVIKKAIQQLDEYFRGERKVFDLPLRPKGTEFQRRVWAALLSIPHGETRSYKDLAIKIQNPKAYRAVGMANNKNPLPIVIPCHRVIGSNRKLIGYRGGLDIKEKLLGIENDQEYQSNRLKE